MVKILLMNLSNNVKEISTVSSGETIYIAEALREFGETEVTIVSKYNSKFTVSFEDLNPLESFDKIVVISGSVNFFGGAINETLIKNYQILAKWKGTINILQTDGGLPFKQAWKAIKAKNEKWGTNYTEDEIIVKSPIRIICQSGKIDEVKSQYKLDEFNKDYTFIHFPIDQYVNLFNIPRVSGIEKKYDIVYYGSLRPNRKENIFKFLTGKIAETLNVHIFGTITENKLNSNWLKLKTTKNALKFAEQNELTVSVPTFPSIGKKVKMNKTITEVSKSLTTVILGEKFYNNAMYTVRLWETLNSSSVLLIHDDFDSEHKILEDSFLYFSTQDELIEKVEKLKNNDSLQFYYLLHQKRRLNEIKLNNYSKHFNNTLV